MAGQGFYGTRERIIGEEVTFVLAAGGWVEVSQMKRRRDSRQAGPAVHPVYGCGANGQTLF